MKSLFVMKQLLVLVLAVALVTACSRGTVPSQRPDPPPAPGPAPVAPPPAPGPAPGAVPPTAEAPATRPEPMGFTVHLGDQELLANSGVTLEEAPGPVILRFREVMDRALVEKALLSHGLPEQSTRTWSDDRTLVLKLPEAAAFTFDPGGAYSQDGKYIVAAESARFLHVVPWADVQFYRLPDLLAGRFAPHKNYRLRTSGYGFALAPDGEHALLFPNDPWAGPEPLRLTHLPTGKRSPLSVPGAGPNPWYCCGGWLPDGRLYLIGEGKVYVGDTMGTSLQPLAETFVWSNYLSPDGKQMALWGPGDTDNAEILDLTTGKIRLLPGSFRPQAQDGASRLAWSPDGALLAGTEGSYPRGPRIRILDVTTGEERRSIPGYSLVAWLPSGNLLAWPWKDSPGDGLADLLAPDGRVLRQGLQVGAISPDGRWSASFYNGQAFLLEIATGQSYPIPLQGRPRWAGPDLLYTIVR